jgi:hypothetical protein
MVSRTQTFTNGAGESGTAPTGTDAALAGTLCALFLPLGTVIGEEWWTREETGDRRAAANMGWPGGETSKSSVRDGRGLVGGV